MGFTEKFEATERTAADAAQQEQEQGQPQTRERRDSSLAGSLRENSNLFGEYLATRGRDDLVVKIAKKDFNSTQEFTELRPFEAEFQNIKRKAAIINEKLRNSRNGSLETLIEASPELQELAQLGGVEGLRKVLGEQLDQVAVHNPERFAEIEGYYEQIAQAEAATKELDQKVRDICNRYGFSENAYMDALNSGNPEDLKRLIWVVKNPKEQKKTTAAMLAQEVQEADTREDLERVIGNIRQARRDLGSYFNESFFRAPVLAEALKAEILQSTEREATFSEAARDAVTMASKDDPDATKKAYREWFAAHEGQEGFDPEDAAELFSREYIAQKKKKRKQQTGFWAEVFGVLLKEQIKQSVTR